jgi:UDP-N-acetyl-D-glucosamine dehydrogenase
VIRLLARRGARVLYHDPHVPRLQEDAVDLASVPLTAETLAAADCTIIVTDHTRVDYALVQRHARLVVDTRNALARVRPPEPAT